MGAAIKLRDEVMIMGSIFHCVVESRVVNCNSITHLEEMVKAEPDLVEESAEELKPLKYLGLIKIMLIDITQCCFEICDEGHFSVLLKSLICVLLDACGITGDEKEARLAWENKVISNKTGLIRRIRKTFKKKKENAEAEAQDTQEKSDSDDNYMFNDEQLKQKLLHELKEEEKRHVFKKENSGDFSPEDYGKNQETKE